MTRLALTACAVLFAAPAAAQVQAPHTLTCLPTPVLYERLSDRFDEARVARGLRQTPRGLTAVELWASEGGATWTVVLTLAEGASCVVVAGSHWQGLPPAPAGEPS
jgi:hypothetical protein